MLATPPAPAVLKLLYITLDYIGIYGPRARRGPNAVWAAAAHQALGVSLGSGTTLSYTRYVGILCGYGNL